MLKTKFLLLALILSTFAFSFSHAQDKNKSIQEILTEKGIQASEISILISKSDYTLSIMKDTVPLKTFKVVFGFNPVDDKRYEGDGCTPEGDFHMIAKYPHANWSKFIWIDYPTQDSWKKHNASKADGSIAATATIGGEIGIHGVPKGSDLLISTKYNWTLGCIAMKNKDVNEIYPLVSKSTLIRIIH